MSNPKKIFMGVRDQEHVSSAVPSFVDVSPFLPQHQTHPPSSHPTIHTLPFITPRGDTEGGRVKFNRGEKNTCKKKRAIKKKSIHNYSHSISQLIDLSPNCGTPPQPTHSQNDSMIETSSKAIVYREKKFIFKFMVCNTSGKYF